MIAHATNPFIQSVQWWAIVGVVFIATMTDIYSQRIPNWLVFPFFIAGVIASTLAGGFAGLRNSLLGIILGVAPMLLLYLLGGMGMGDVKLCAAIGAWVGPQQMVFVLLFMGLAGGGIALGWSAYRGFLSESLAGAGDLIVSCMKHGLKPHSTLNLKNPAARRIPYAPAIAAGAILSFLTC